MQYKIPGQPRLSQTVPGQNIVLEFVFLPWYYNKVRIHARVLIIVVHGLCGLELLSGVFA